MAVRGIAVNPSSAQGNGLVSTGALNVTYNHTTGGSNLVAGPSGKFGSTTHTLGTGTGRPTPQLPFATVVHY